jgi:hypothetical protein
MFFPSSCAGSSYPSMRAAEGFEKRQVPCESQPQIASVAESSIRRIRSSLLSRASSTWLRIALSSERGMSEGTASALAPTTMNSAPYRDENIGTVFPHGILDIAVISTNLPIWLSLFDSI